MDEVVYIIMGSPPFSNQIQYAFASHFINKCI